MKMVMTVEEIKSSVDATIEITKLVLAVAKDHIDGIDLTDLDDITFDAWYDIMKSNAAKAEAFEWGFAMENGEEVFFVEYDPELLIDSMNLMLKAAKPIIKFVDNHKFLIAMTVGGLKTLANVVKPMVEGLIKPFKKPAEELIKEVNAIGQEFGEKWADRIIPKVDEDVVSYGKQESSDETADEESAIIARVKDVFDRNNIDYTAIDLSNLSPVDQYKTVRAQVDAIELAGKYLSTTYGIVRTMNRTVAFIYDGLTEETFHVMAKLYQVFIPSMDTAYFGIGNAILSGKHTKEDEVNILNAANTAKASLNEFLSNYGRAVDVSNPTIVSFEQEFFIAVYAWVKREEESFAL